MNIEIKVLKSIKGDTRYAIYANGRFNGEVKTAKEIEPFIEAIEKTNVRA